MIRSGLSNIQIIIRKFMEAPSHTKINYIKKLGLDPAYDFEEKSHDSDMRWMKMIKEADKLADLSDLMGLKLDKKVALLLIATGKYTQYLPALLESIDKYFLKRSKVTVNVFTDNFQGLPMDYLNRSDRKAWFIEHKPWPYPTMHRFHFFEAYQQELINEGYDYYFYLDADTLLKDGIYEDEVLFNSTLVQHCGFVGKRGSFETRPESGTYVPPHEGVVYYGGGFWGFKSVPFWEFVNKAVKILNRDEVRGITPVWHDESVLNKIFSVFSPERVLSPSFHWPENNKRIWDMWPEQYPCKILLLDKNHAEVRGENKAPTPPENVKVL